MGLTGIGGNRGVYRSAPPASKRDTPLEAAPHGTAMPDYRSTAKTDTVEISGEADYLNHLRKPFSQMSLTEEDGTAAEPEESSSSGGCVGINAAKLARLLAAAKTQSQVRAVIAQIQADLEECERGRAQGYDVDESSEAAAEQLLQQAQARLGQTENREPTPEEQMASSLAALM